MSRDPVVLVAKVALIAWTIATLTLGALSHFADDGARYQPWVLPMCILTLMGAILVDRAVKARKQRG